MKYKIDFYKGNYSLRQKSANADRAAVYVEHHFNGGGASANYALCNVATNASGKSRAVAKSYVDKISRAFSIPVANNDFAKAGVSVGGYQGRGNGNLASTNMPAILLEPLFASNPRHADIIRSETGQITLARCLVETIVEHFPNGGLIAFSVGHKYKTDKPLDRGVPLAGGGTEADYAEKVLIKAAGMLSAIE